MASTTQNTLEIWQWNCASFATRKTPLLQYIKAQPKKPHVILLQETLCDTLTLSGYHPISQRGDTKRGIATLISKKFAHIVHEVLPTRSRLEAILVELVPNRFLKQSVFILNVYSSPSDYRQSFHALLTKATTLARNSPLVIAGDFNAPHPSWGYPQATAKGTNLTRAIDDLSLTLITDHRFPTRLGTSVQRDTTPDLVFTRNVTGHTWTNTQENLGSDHFIIRTELPNASAPPRTFTLTDWDAFRTLRKNNTKEYNTFIELLTSLQEDIAKTTKTIQTELEVPRMDPHLAHLLEAKASILARWKTQRLNRRLRKRLSILNQDIAKYCTELTRLQWHELCSAVDGRMRTGGKWNLLKYMLDDCETKNNQSHAIDRLLHSHKKMGGTNSSFLEEISKRHLPLNTAQPTDYPEIECETIPELDEPFTESEIREALHNLNSRSAPGPDKVTNRLLRNLDDQAITLLTKDINYMWETGQVPEQWRTATVILLSKPGKPLNFDNLRPISLTSCIGKAAEHVILNRVSRYIEDHELFPFNMVGFRPHLSTQDVMLLLKKQIFDSKTRDVRGILALDLTKAFDSVSHRFILESIASLGLGKRFQAYIRSFLQNRKAQLHLSQLTSDTYTLGSNGTPQGAVISPLLFNIVMKGLSDKLRDIPNINHAIYADDITIWCPGGSLAELEQALQTALDTTEAYLKNTGLRLSPTKSELLLYRQSRQGVRNLTPLGDLPIALHAKDGQRIPRVDSIRILGLLVEATGCHARTIKHITAKTENMLRLIQRVSGRRRGLGEANLLRIYHAFLMSHINYVASAHNWTKVEKTKLNTLMRKSIKQVLGLPQNTSTSRLDQLGMHNGIDEVIEAQTTAQVIRLSSSKAGRRLLSEAGMSPHPCLERAVTLPRVVRATYMVTPFPRNVHPQHNEGRRLARARAILNRTAANRNSTAFVDAAQYGNSSSFALAVVDGDGALRSAASVRLSTSAIAEQVAIALAMTDPSLTNVFTDSRAAIRAYETGNIAPEAARILQTRKYTGSHYLSWFPAHMGKDVHPQQPNLNEMAHDRARELTRRDDQSATEELGPDVQFNDPLLTFHEITSHYRHNRSRYPLPHSKLERAQEVAFRMLQTRSYPSRGRLSHYNSDINSQCPDCTEVYCSLAHMLWQCPALPQGPLTSESDWEEALRSPNLRNQLKAVQRAQELAERHHVPAPTRASPTVAAARMSHVGTLVA